MHVAYLSSTGSDDPTKASIAFHLAVNGSVPEGQHASLALLGDAGGLLIGDTPDTLEGLGLPPLRELLDKVIEHELPVYV